MVKLITRGTIEEHIHRCAVRKLKLDSSISRGGGGGETGGEDGAKEGDDVADGDPATLMELLREELTGS